MNIFVRKLGIIIDSVVEVLLSIIIFLFFRYRKIEMC